MTDEQQTIDQRRRMRRRQEARNRVTTSDGDSTSKPQKSAPRVFHAGGRSLAARGSRQTRTQNDVRSEQPHPQHAEGAVQRRASHHAVAPRRTTHAIETQDAHTPSAAKRAPRSAVTAASSSRRRAPRRQMTPLPTRIEASLKKPQQAVPVIARDTLRIIPVGGNEEVGRNMNVFEYGNDVVVVDMGMQFPEEDMPGIDYIVPNISYLRGKEKNIRAVIFTHGHLDHIGAAPILLEQLNYPPVVARDLTLALIKKKVADYDPSAISRLKTISIKDVKRPLRLGNMIARFFEVEHSIMDSMGVALETPAGTAIHMGDWTINHNPVDGKMITYEHLKNLPEPRILLLESLGSIKTDKKSEKVVQGNLQTLIDHAPGRLIIGTFASQIKRISLILQHAQNTGKKVALDGYSMRTNIEIAQELGYLNIRKDLIIPITDIDKYPDKNVIIICTGAQGEANASLNRIVTGNHRSLTLKKTDTIVFSSSVIPGNERSVQRLKDNMYRKCEHVIHSDIMDIHMGGHSTSGDIKDVLHMVEPQYFVPVYANHFMLKEAGKRATEIGFPEKNIFVMDNGQVLDIAVGKAPRVLAERADASYVFIDGLGVGDIGHVVLRDRQMLSEDGMFAVTVIVDSRTKEVVGNVQVTSRGFIYVKDNFDLLNETKKKVKEIIKRTTSKDTRMDWKFVENEIRDAIGDFLFQKTQRRPMVLPVVVEV